MKKIEKSYYDVKSTSKHFGFNNPSSNLWSLVGRQSAALV